MPSSLKHIILKLFAGDTHCFYAGHDLDALLKNIEDDMESFNKWIRANKLTINLDPIKSCYSIFKPQNKTIPNTYKKGIKIGNHTLAYQTWTKYLGIYLNDELSWENHIFELNKKITKYIGIFCKLRYFVSKECLNVSWLCIMHSYFQDLIMG